jgi:hypothetical protein
MMQFVLQTLARLSATERGPDRAGRAHRMLSMVRTPVASSLKLGAISMIPEREVARDILDAADVKIVSEE